MKNSNSITLKKIANIIIPLPLKVHNTTQTKVVLKAKIIPFQEQKQDNLMQVYKNNSTKAFEIIFNLSYFQEKEHYHLN